MTTAASLLDPNLQPPRSQRERWAQKITDFLSVPAYAAPEKEIPLCSEQQRLVNLAFHMKNRDVLISMGRRMLMSGRLSHPTWDLR